MYQVPEGTYVHDKTAKRTMVYLERERLLVPQSIYRFAFERVRN
jgi:hypothetical protein